MINGPAIFGSDGMKNYVFAASCLLLIYPSDSSSGAQPELANAGAANVATLVDLHVNRALEQQQIRPGRPADDLTLLRRTTLDLIGRIPTVAEAQAFVASTSVTKRQELVDRLMDSSGFAQQQANSFNAFLMHETSADLRDYLRAAFEEGRPWHEMFRDMLAVNGGPHSPAEEYVKARVKDLDKLTNDASAMFFGVNVSCAKCHDHPLVPEWSQDHFYGMKSFFARTFELGEFLGEQDYGDVKFKTTEGEEKLAQMMFLTGTVIAEPEEHQASAEEIKAHKKKLAELKKNKQPPPSPSFSRRLQLADVALRAEENRYFARAITNRIWYQLVGHGLVMPLDQMHPENEGSHPELLDALAQDLIAHDYDLRRLIRGIVLSDTYGRSSRWEDGERPSAESFATAQVRALDPYQYASTLQLATTAPDQFSLRLDSAELGRRLVAVEEAAAKLASKFEQPYDGFQIGVTEALLVNNNQELVKQLLRDDPGSLLGKLLSITDNRLLLETAVWNVLVRPADQQEIEFLGEFLDGRKDRRAACQQLVWALLASSEVRFNY